MAASADAVSDEASPQGRSAIGSAGSLELRVRWAVSGQEHEVQLPAGSTLGDLRQEVNRRFFVPPSRQMLRRLPPDNGGEVPSEPAELVVAGSLSTPIEEYKFAQGDTLLLVQCEEVWSWVDGSGETADRRIEDPRLADLVNCYDREGNRPGEYWVGAVRVPPHREFPTSGPEVLAFLQGRSVDGASSHEPVFCAFEDVPRLKIVSSGYVSRVARFLFDQQGHTGGPSFSCRASLALRAMVGTLPDAPEPEAKAMAQECTFHAPASDPGDTWTQLPENPKWFSFEQEDVCIVCCDPTRRVISCCLGSARSLAAGRAPAWGF